MQVLKFMSPKKDPFKIKNSLGTVPGFNEIHEQGNNFFTVKPKEQIARPVSRSKARLISIVVVMALLSLGLRLFWLQIINKSDYQAFAEGNRIRVERITAERGIIYDRFGTALVQNVPALSVYFTPAYLPQEKDKLSELASQLSVIIGKSSSDILSLFSQYENNPYENILICENLSHDQAVLLELLSVNAGSIKLVVEPARKYLEHSSLSHILGYVGRINAVEFKSLEDQDYNRNDYIGKDGIELFYEHLLKGVHGIREIEVDSLGRQKKVLNQKTPLVGSDIYLTIDIDLQQKIAESLSQAIKSAPDSRGGVAIAIDPLSGEILALVSQPDFDNNFFSAGIDPEAYQKYINDPGKPLFNRAVSGSYPPGSIFKPIVGAAALEQGIIDQSKTFLSTGGIRVGQWFFPDWKYGGHGRINIITAIAESVNTFFYYIGGGYNQFDGLGVDTISDYASRFNLGHKTGVDLPGESNGFIPSKSWKQEHKGESWYIGDTYHLAIGQGDILVTPIQVAAYLSVFANKGNLYQPHLLKQVQNTDNPTIVDIQEDYVINPEVISPENIDIIRQGMRAAVTRGSATSLSWLSTTSAGKTGTAQVGGDKDPHAWFIGFAPYENPKIALVVLIENGGEGSSAATPVFKQVIDWYFSETK